MFHISQVGRVDMEMPNVHYFLADLAKIGMENNNEVSFVQGVRVLL